MNAASQRARLRVVEMPLTEPEVRERPSKAEWDRMWRDALQVPVPDYSAEVLRRWGRG